MLRPDGQGGKVAGMEGRFKDQPGWDDAVAAAGKLATRPVPEHAFFSVGELPYDGGALDAAAVLARALEWWKTVDRKVLTESIYAGAIRRGEQRARERERAERDIRASFGLPAEGPLSAADEVRVAQALLRMGQPRS